MKIKIRKTVVLYLRLLAIAGMLMMLIGPQFMDAQAAPSAIPTGQRLRALAGPFYIGFASVNNFWSLSDAAQYQETARTEFNILTPENAMKWDAIHPQQTTYSFAQADQHVQWAQQNNMAVHGHTLVWHSQNPAWLQNGSWTSTTLTNVLYDHIDTVMGRYQGDILVWDVVNEAFDDGAQPRNSVWRSVIGPNYIDLAFQRARQADPEARLIYNDYNIETINSKSTAVYNMISSMKSRGIPIDGVGFQMHLTSGGINTQSLADNMQRFAQLGLEIYITEMDVRYPAPISQANLTAQANIYGNVLDRCLAQPACKALQVWGFTDKYSWVPDFEPGSGDALIFDASYNAKPAYYALQAQLAEIGPTSTPTRTPTGPTPTFTQTSTPTRTPTLGPSSLKIQLSGSGTDNNQQTGFRLRVQNAGSSALSNVSARIYFTPDGSNAASSYVLEKYYDQSGVATISGPTQASGNTYYFTVNYGTASLPAGGAWEYHTALHLNNWGSTYSSANDWWRMSGALPASYTDWTSIPAYVNGSLVWGIEPTSGPTNTPTATVVTNTPTRTPTFIFTPTGVTVTPSRTPTFTFTPTATFTQGPGTCSPVTAVKTAPFTQDGAGTFCWQTSNLGSFINSWNLTSLTINGVDFTNKYASASSYPAQINGFWYISYTGNFPWSHFEAK